MSSDPIRRYLSGPWKQWLKTTYYLRSRPATRIAKATVATTSAQVPQQPAVLETTDAEAIACSLENPEHCEACE